MNAAFIAIIMRITLLESKHIHKKIKLGFSIGVKTKALTF